jgi:hypothetical protein
MSERCILAVRFTPAGSLGQVRKAVGGFLRYVQHRDLHADEKAAPPNPKVSGLLKYVAYRDRASARAELFGPSGTLGSTERKAFAALVVRSLEESRPQLYRTRDGELVDRRRAVYRLVISPERAQGLDLRGLATAVVGRLEKEAGIGGLRWVAAIHRNTAHPHVHLVLAGMREAGAGYVRVDLTKPRLAAMKQALAQEIERQREPGPPTLITRAPAAGVSESTGRSSTRSLARLRALGPNEHRRPAARWQMSHRPTVPAASLWHRHRPQRLPVPAIFRRLQLAAARYRHQMERELEEEIERRNREGRLR